MEWVHKEFRRTRERLGLSQVALSQLSGVSLPTLQLFEGGRGNPSLSTLSAIATALGHDLKVERKGANWDFLSAAGAPILADEKNKETPTETSLLRELRLALLEVSEEGAEPRKADAAHALCLALKTHYPDTFRKIRSPLSEALLSREITGPILKLRRISLSRLAVFL